MPKTTTLSASITSHHAQNFETVKKFWHLVDAQSHDMLANLTGDNRRLFQAIRDGARDAYFRAINEQLEDNNALISQVRAELDALTGTLEAELQTITAIETTLNKLVDAVKLASSLVSLAAA
jgi:hypothetical protein